MYRKFLKSIEKIKAFHDLDRVENPGADPMGMYPGRNDVVGVSVSYDGPPVA